jgi:pantetheine-phosphate adenylyltransferase
MKVCIGGTFDVLHKGHKQLLNTAFQRAGKHGFVFIGITTGMLAGKRPEIASFEQRKKAIEEYLEQVHITQRFIIKPIQDKYGPTVEEDFDAIIVSPETRSTAEEINQLRIQKRMKPLQIIQIPFVLAEDHQPVSSSRIRRKEIDTEGRIPR